jgi:hypothetical protein
MGLLNSSSCWCRYTGSLGWQTVNVVLFHQSIYERFALYEPLQIVDIFLSNDVNVLKFKRKLMLRTKTRRLLYDFVGAQENNRGENKNHTF